MAKGSAKAVLLVVVGAMLLGCAAYQPKAFSPVNLASKVKAGLMTQKVDTFLVILDASASMAHRYQGAFKLNIAKDFVSRMNQTIPDLKLLAGLRTFGRCIFSYEDQTRLVYGMKDYARDGYEEALKPVTWAGLSPLSAGRLAVGLQMGSVACNLSKGEDDAHTETLLHLHAAGGASAGWPDPLGVRRRRGRRGRRLRRLGEPDPHRRGYPHSCDGGCRRRW